MKIKTISNGDLEIVMEARMKTPYPALKREVAIDGQKADVVVVTSQLTCRKDGKIYQGYHAYILAEV